MDDVFDHALQTPKQQVTCDDKEGHYIVTPDDIIYKRCKFLPSCFSACANSSSDCPDRTVRLLGQGTFGKVVEAVDIETNKRVAIKIIRAIQKYREASRIEVRVLQKLKERDPVNRQCVCLPITCTMHPQLTYPFIVNASTF